MQNQKTNANQEDQEQDGLMMQKGMLRNWVKAWDRQN